MVQARLFPQMVDSFRPENALLTFRTLVRNRFGLTDSDARGHM